MQSNTCSFTGRLQKQANVGKTSKDVPVCSANVILNDDVVVAVQAFGDPAVALSKAEPNQQLTIIGVIAFSDARQRFEVKASTVALVPDTQEAQ